MIIVALIFSVIAFAAQDYFAYRRYGSAIDRRVRNWYVWTTIFIYFIITVLV